MDQLPEFGRSIFHALLPTFKAYAVLHEKNRANIESTPREEFQYGSEKRQNLDLYLPAQVSEETPILVFFYGGGLSRGDKRLPSPPTAKDLVYANIGHYFTSHGFITVVPDYRRTGEGAVFPSGGADVAASVAWVKNRFSTGKHKLYIMGNSAGAIHSSTFLLEPRFADSRLSLQSGSVILDGVVLVSIPAHFKAADATRSEVLTAYYGDKAQQHSAFGLLEQAQPVEVRTLVVTGTLDPEDEICEPSDDFVKRWKSQFGDSKLTTVVLDGHNHFSTTAALGTGIAREESLGTEVLKWIEG
ncbi:hypothetical protein MBLNU459_g0863t1 [Dothideomycetes sp. NU459]